jgi:hypothetical protein
VTDCADVTWRDLVGGLRYLAGGARPIPNVEKSAAQRLAASTPPRAPSVRRSLQHLLSSEVRDTLREDPLIARIESVAKSFAGAMPSPVEKALRRQVDPVVRHAASSSGPGVSIPLLRQQLRQVRYSCESAQSALGYRPVVSFPQSMDAFHRWYQEAFGWNTDWWSLLNNLHA